MNSKLILCGTRNGFKNRIFHEICDNKPRTLTIIKVNGSSEILGWYNPLEWKSDNKYAMPQPMIVLYSLLKNNYSINNHILSRVKYRNFAISNHPDRSPAFGETDLVLRGKTKRYNGICKINSYEKQLEMIVVNFL